MVEDLTSPLTALRCSFIHPNRYVLLIWSELFQLSRLGLIIPITVLPQTASLATIRYRTRKVLAPTMTMALEISQFEELLNYQTEILIMDKSNLTCRNKMLINGMDCDENRQKGTTNIKTKCTDFTG